LHGRYFAIQDAGGAIILPSNNKVQAKRHGGSRTVHNTTTNWTGVLFGLALAVLAAFQQFKLPPVLPELFDLYGHDPLLAAGFMSVFAIAGLTLSFGMGTSLPRLGMARTVYAATALLAVGCLLALWIPAQGWLFLFARGLEAIGFTMLAIIGPTLCTRNAAQAHLPVAAALIATWIPLGALIANGLAIAAWQAGDWRALWWMGVAASLGMAAWAAWLSRRHSIDLGTVPKQTTENSGSTSPAQNLSLVLVAAIFMMWSCQYFAYMTWLPEYLVREFGFTTRLAILSYTIPVAIIVAFNLLAAPILRRGVPVGALLAIVLAGQAIIWFLVPVTDSGWSGLVSLLVYGALAGVTATCLFAMPGTIFGTGGATARSFAIMMTGRNMGVLAGPLLLAGMIKYLQTWDYAGPVLGAVTAVNMVCALILTRRLAAARAAQGMSR